MAVTQPITPTLIRDSIVKAVQNVCKTMMNCDTSLRAPLSDPPPIHTYQLLGNVGFAGDANGVVFLCLTDDFAKFATGQMLGMTPAEVEENGFEVIKDAIGEITNMTAGGFKNHLCDIGLPCKLTLPTIVRGKELEIAALKGSHRHVFEFDCSGHILTADIQIKID